MKDRSGEKLGRYELLDRVACGGMAEIYTARLVGPERFQKPLALKLIRPERRGTQVMVDMFLEEARFAARLNHPNIAQVFELGDDNGCFFLAMELVQGPDLAHLKRHLVETSRRIPIKLACHIIARVAEGLHFAHEQVDAETELPLGIVHRDVSPQNILVSRFGEVKLVDFGVAFAEHFEFKTGATLNAGKAAYMSPEQRRGEPVDRRTDVYAAGIVLHELLTGRGLFPSTSSGPAVPPAHETYEIAPPSVINPEVPAELDAIVMRALQRDRALRYPTAQALSDALDAWISSANALAGENAINPRAALAAWMRGLPGMVGPKTMGVLPVTRAENAGAARADVTEQAFVEDESMPCDLGSLVMYVDERRQLEPPPMPEITQLDPEESLTPIQSVTALDAPVLLESVTLRDQIEPIAAADLLDREALVGSLDHHLAAFLHASTTAPEACANIVPVPTIEVVRLPPRRSSVRPVEIRPWAPTPEAPPRRSSSGAGRRSWPAPRRSSQPPAAPPPMTIVRGTPVQPALRLSGTRPAGAAARVWAFLCKALGLGGRSVRSTAGVGH